MSEKKENKLVLAEGEKLYLLSALVKEEADLNELVDFLAKHELSIKKSENLGSKTLSFAVNKNHELLLTSVFFTAATTVIPALEKSLHHEEYVQRFLLTDWNGDIDAPKRNSDRHRTKAAAGAENV